MATERNPFDRIPEQETNVVPLTAELEEMNATFEVDDDGGVTVDFSDNVEMEAAEDIAEWYGNMTEDMDEDDLADIAATVIENFEADKDSRAEWESMFERGFDLLGLKLEQGTEPFDGACTAVHPLLIESAVKFQSKASGELFPANGPIKTRILGKSTPEKELQANRVQNFMNYQVTEQMPEYFDEFERMLFHLPLIGSAFKKLYYDATVKRPRSEFIPIDQFYVSYYATDLSNADRYTHVIYRSPVEIQKDIRAGVYEDIELSSPSSDVGTSFSEKMDTIIGLSPTSGHDPQYVLLEQHCYLSIEDEDEACPYIVTVEQQSRQVLSIRRNYKQDDPNKEKVNHFVHYRFVPGFGFYGLGLIHFLGNLTMKFADSTEQVISDAASYGPVGTTMALLEASSKFFTAIHKRVHKSQKDEFRILARIDYEYLPQEYPYDVPYEDRSIFRQDFDGRIDIIPVSDPNIPSNAHRMMMANMALQMAQQSPPGMFNLEALNRTILNAANMPNADEILPPKIEPKPMDPVSDIMAATKGIPIGAFPGQNHDAHIQVKMAYLQDPVNGANPIMQRVAPIIQANIQEHSVMKYQEQMSGISEQMLQQVPDQMNNPAAAEMAMAEASKQILNANQAMGMAQSPEQQLVSLEQAKVELEKQKLQADTATNAAELELKNKKLELEENEQIIGMMKATATDNLKRDNADANRSSKEKLKQMELMTKAIIEDFKLNKEDERQVLRNIKEMLDKEMQTKADMDTQALNALVQMAVQQQQEMINDEER